MFVALDAFVAFDPLVVSETASFPGLVCFSTSDDDLCDGRFLDVILPIIPTNGSERLLSYALATRIASKQTVENIQMIGVRARIL
jgi:hypothetical protein